MTRADRLSNSGDLGAVVIGRNEGERLRLCLESVVERVAASVYVDSGSTDDSVELAESLGVTVVHLSNDVPFTAARARNAGFRRLLEIAPDMSLVQFVDGDCEVDDDWWKQAVDTLDRDENIVVVCGRQQEVNRNRTIYNRMVDIEWDTPVGEAKACGGCAMFRVQQFVDVGGFDPTVIAGEEPELCVRLRATGSTIVRIDAKMTRHDADMTRFSQWWMRNVRAGHAYAQGSAMHGRPPNRHWVRETRSIWFWAFWLPLLTAVLIAPTRGWSLILLAGYTVVVSRIWRHIRQRGYDCFDSAIFTCFTTLGKWPQLYGQFKYGWRRLRNRHPKIIEYKAK